MRHVFCTPRPTLDQPRITNYSLNPAQFSRPGLISLKRFCGHCLGRCVCVVYNMTTSFVFTYDWSKRSRVFVAPCPLIELPNTADYGTDFLNWLISVYISFLIALYLWLVSSVVQRLVDYLLLLFECLPPHRDMINVVGVGMQPRSPLSACHC